jgi:hypothetical protein
MNVVEPGVGFGLLLFRSRDPSDVRPWGWRLYLAGSQVECSSPAQQCKTYEEASAAAIERLAGMLRNRARGAACDLEVLVRSTALDRGGFVVGADAAAAAAASAGLNGGAG